MQTLLPGLEPAVTLYEFEVGGEIIQIPLTGEHRNARYKAALKARAEAGSRDLRGRMNFQGTRARSLS